VSLYRSYIEAREICGRFSTTTFIRLSMIRIDFLNEITWDVERGIVCVVLTLEDVNIL